MAFVAGCVYAERVTTATKLDKLRDHLVGKSVAGTAIVDASPEISETRDGEDLTRVSLVLTPPSTETWDLEVVHQVREMVETEARALELPSTFVRFGAEGDEDVGDLKT
ncbi:MAG: hypothetical protein ACRDK5_08970 [Solirubrobacterales bacterium]